MATYTIPVPGQFTAGTAYLDVETSKVPTPDGYRMPNGEPLRRRWAVELVGIARDGVVAICDGEGNERQALEDAAGCLYGASQVVYGATRQFDEMVLRGRFTNARRALLPVPTWPALPGAERLVWRNVGPVPYAPYRAADVPSRNVPHALAAGQWDKVAVHLLRDVAELVLAHGQPDAACARWCRKVLSSWSYAVTQVYGCSK